MAIFQKSVINKHLSLLDKSQVDEAYAKFVENYNPAKIAISIISEIFKLNPFRKSQIFLFRL